METDLGHLPKAAFSPIVIAFECQNPDRTSDEFKKSGL